jgi:hypothetical protein
VSVRRVANPRFGHTSAVAAWLATITSLKGQWGASGHTGSGSPPMSSFVAGATQLFLVVPKKVRRVLLWEAPCSLKIPEKSAIA